MRKVLVVVVIAGCWREPAPQTPVSTGAVEHRTPPPEHRTPSLVGRLEVVEAPRTHQRRDLERDYGPVIASGTEAGRSWYLRGQIDARGGLAISLMISTSGGGGGGGGRGGGLPFQDLGWKKLGHFGSVGSGENHGTGIPCTLTLKGVVSKQTAAIEVRLADGTSLPAHIIDTGDPRASFFVAIWSTPSHWEALIARDAAGAELETYRPFPTQATATQACATSTP